MNDQINDPATEEAGSTALPLAEVTAATEKQSARPYLRAARRDLSEEELATPAVRRFLIAEIERLEQENVELRVRSEKCHDVEKSLAVLQAEAKPASWNDILAYVCLSIGSAGLGAAPSYISISNFGWVFAILSAILLAVGIASRVFK